MTVHTLRRARITRAVLGAAALAAALTGIPASHAELTPEWMVRLPAGTALSVGLTGMVVDAEGVAYVAGTVGPSNNLDVRTVAIGPDGNILWTDTFDSASHGSEQARGVGLGQDGALYVTGTTPGPMQFANVLVLKYDRATGTRLKVIQFSNGVGTSEHGQDVTADAAGNIFVVGGTTGDGGDALALELDSAGTLEWQQPWDGPAWGPYSQDSAWRLRLDAAGNPVSMIHGVMNSLHPDYIVVKYSAGSGAPPLWQANWGVNGGDFPQDMELDASDDVYVTGTGINFTDQYSTIKLAGETGALLWQAYDYVGPDDYAQALALDAAGGVYVTGGSDPDGNHSNFNDNFYTVKRAAADGALVWTHFYGQNCIGCYDVARDVLADGYGHVFVAGETSSAPYSSDMIVFALSADTGAELERGVVSGTAIEMADAYVLRADAAQNIYVAGEFYNVNTGAVDMAVIRYAALVPAILVGDLDCDGSVSFSDINPFVLAVSNAASYADAFPDCDVQSADVDGDGSISFGDINPFIALLSGG